jgi:hypothetical protein
LHTTSSDVVDRDQVIAIVAKHNSAPRRATALRVLAVARWVS